MLSLVRTRLALLAAVFLLSAASGCGDNAPNGSGIGKAGNDGGMTGAAGVGGRDGGSDADANGDVKTDGLPDGIPDLGTDKPDSTGAGGSDGGAGTGAAGSDGGAGTGAAGSDGGAGTGAAGSDGGAGTGAAGSDGGAGTGAAGSDGGAGTGAAGSDGGAGTGAAGTTAPPACYAVTFTNPVDLAQFSAADDKDTDNCVNGFQHDVVITTAAPNGTSVKLFAGAANVATATATGGQVTFPGVPLPGSGDTVLSIQFPSTMPCTAASTKAKVTVDCSVPACSVTKPVISVTHPKLNGVPATSGGDRVSATGSPYEAAFEVTTNIANNQNVFLDINDAATPGTVTTVSAKASGGKAVFGGVALPPGATFTTYQIQARCIDGNGVVGRSTKGSYPVDATAPVLAVSQPASGDFIGPGGLVNGAFEVCGSTTSTDAVALPAGLGSGAQNFCASVSGSPICKAVATVSTRTCVNVACPGDAPFSITVTLNDEAGNPTTQVINGVTCSSTMPNVQIITPISDAPSFNDPTRHLLSASAAQTFRDQTGAVAGAQTNVVACSSRAGTAALLAGHAGTSLVQVGGTVITTTATALDGCPTGLGFVAKFVGVTLPESLENAAGVLTTATQIRVDVTDVSASVGKSSALDLWVDSVAPVFALTSPVGLCGSFQQAFATFDTSIVYSSDTPKITLSITNNSATDTHSSPTYASGTATFPTVSFNQGQSNLAAIASDEAGNKSAAPQPCTVTAGMAPVVFFTAPTSTNQLCPSNGLAPNCVDDADANTAGWQGSLTVHALVGGSPITTGNITFSAGGAPLGVAALNALGDATLNNVTLFDGTVTITAQTANIPGNGVGIGTLTIGVDLGAPDSVPAAGLAVQITDRRQTTMLLKWKAPGDHGQRVAGYDVRYAKVPITTANFDDTAVTTAVTYTGTPSLPTADDSVAIEDLYIENDYYFALRPVDSAGNRGGVTATSAATKAQFNVTSITNFSGVADRFGFSTSGDGDLNGDGLSDIVVGTNTVGRVYIFFGSTTFPAAPATPPAPSVTITSASANFGFRVAQIGDIDNDGRPDLAITDNLALKVYIYKGRDAWPMTLTDAQADYVITGDATYAGVFFGFSLARLGDFTGDGIDDFAFGVRSYASNIGRVVVVPGKASGFASFSLPSTANTITIDGDPAFGNSFFGYRIIGVGHYYPSATGGTTMVVSANNGTLSTPASVGHVYAFRGQTGTAGVIPIAAADHVTAGNVASARMGNTLVNLGPMLNGFAGVATGNSLNNGEIVGSTGTVYVMSGAPATGPFTSRKVVYGEGLLFGTILVGGGVSGRDQVESLIGDATPDLVVGSQSTLAIFDGAKFGAKTSPINAATDAEIKVPLPSGWGGSAESTGALVLDINGDDATDFCLGGVSTFGGLVVYW